LIARYRAAAHDGASSETLRARALDMRHDCFETIRDDACRAALTAEYEDYAAAMVRVASACRDAYCPRLPAPKPPLCATSGAPVSDDPTRSETIVLLAAIRAYEIDVPLAEIADIPPPTLPPPSGHARAPDDPSVAVLRVACASRPECDLALFDATCHARGHWPLGDPALGPALRDAGAVAARLGASRDVPYAKVIDTLDQLREAGVSDVEFRDPLCDDAGNAL
jgi:hypothetical protein